MIPVFCKFLGYKEVGSGKPDLPPVRYITLTRSTPSLTGPGRKVSGSPAGIYAGAVELLNSEVIHSFKKLAVTMEEGLEKSQFHKPIVKLLEMVASSCPNPVPGKSVIGKLGFKVEAAGKVRVFAMVECWTQ